MNIDEEAALNARAALTTLMNELNRCTWDDLITISKEVCFALSIEIEASSIRSPELSVFISIMESITKSLDLLKEGIVLKTVIDSKLDHLKQQLAQLEKEIKQHEHN